MQGEMTVGLNIEEEEEEKEKSGTRLSGGGRKSLHGSIVD